MPYDPFRRGQAPVGVRTIVLEDPDRDGREVPVELWHPAAETHRGQDLDPATQDRFVVAPGLPEEAQRAVRDAAAAPLKSRPPLVLFFHGALGHRRGSTDLCSHLASHGYLVAAPDFTGHTLADQVHDAASGATEGLRVRSTEQTVVDRPLDAKLVMDRLLAEAGFADVEEVGPVGSCGVSLGGWTCLAVNSIDRRPVATVPIVPAWGAGPLESEFLSTLVSFEDWGRPVATLVLAAERDAMVMLEALRQLHRDLPAPKRLAILKNAGHVHFSDNAERRHESLRAMLTSNFFPGGDKFDLPALAEACRPFAELCPASHGHDTACALTLAQMDAHLKGDPRAKAFLSGDLEAVFSARGIGLETA